MRVAPHHHPCKDCQKKTECPSTWEENFDGEPPVICPEWHMQNGYTNPDFVCDDCQLARDYAAIEEAKAAS